MTLPLAKRLSVIQPSATIAIADRAAALKAKGVDVLSFGLGEPDFDTPLHIREAAKQALDRGQTRYTRVRGIPALCQAIARDATRRRGVPFEASNVVVSVGAKHSLFNLALALLDPGDEVVIPAPYWVSYPEQVLLMGGVPRVVPTDDSDGFLLTPAALEGALGPKTKVVLLCTPSNPTGAAYGRAQLERLAEVLRRHDCWIVVDEIYGQLVYDGFEQVSLVTVAPDLRDRIVLVDGASKSYAMTGWRIGWTLSSPALASALEMVQSQATSNPASVSQYAALAALEGDASAMTAMVREFDARRRLMVEGLRAIPGFACRMPEGAFYAFPSVTGLYGKQAPAGELMDDLAVTGFLLEEARVAVVPGSPFGAPGFVRLSYAASQEQVREGLRRIAEAVRKLG